MTVQLLRIPEAASRLGVSEDTVHRLISTGRLKAKSLGPRKTRIEESALVAFVESCEDIGQSIRARANEPRRF